MQRLSIPIWIMRFESFAVTVLWWCALPCHGRSFSKNIWIICRNHTLQCLCCFSSFKKKFKDFPPACDVRHPCSFHSHMKTALHVSTCDCSNVTSTYTVMYVSYIIHDISYPNNTDTLDRVMSRLSLRNATRYDKVFVILLCFLDCVSKAIFCWAFHCTTVQQP